MLRQRNTTVSFNAFVRNQNVAPIYVDQHKLLTVKTSLVVFIWSSFGDLLLTNAFFRQFIWRHLDYLQTTLRLSPSRYKIDQRRWRGRKQQGSKTP
jgi:hypothetical protein